jgi:hypothetical protein
LPVAGYWLLVAGGWLLVAGYWGLAAVRNWMLFEMVDDINLEP